MRTTLPTAQGVVVHLFVVYGYQGSEEDAEKLRLTDRLLQAVLAEAQVVCVGQPMLIAGDLNADPAVIPCLGKGISAGRYVDLALAYSLGAGLTPDVTCTFNRDDGTGSRRDFFVGCPGALAASQACYVTGRWFTPHFSVLAGFRIGAWWLMLLARLLVSPSGLLAGWILLIDRLRHPLVLFRMSGISIGMCLGLMLLLEVLLLLAALPFLEEVCYVFVAGVWEAELLVAWLLAGCIGSVMVVRLISTVLSSLSTLLFLPCYSFVGVSNLLQMFLRVFGVKGSLSLVGML